MIGAVIFDCDGVLVDSEPLAREAWEQVLAPHGYAIGDDEYARLIGLPYPSTHAHFAERVKGLPEPDAFWREYSGTLFELIDSALEPFGDALETLDGLRSAGLPVAVASSSPRSRLDRTLRCAGLLDGFVATVAGDEVAHGKPAPDLFLAAAERLGVPAARCAVIEDSSPGVAAALAAGMRVVGVARGPGDAARLADADAVVERLSAAAVLGV